MVAVRLIYADPYKWWSVKELNQRVRVHPSASQTNDFPTRVSLEDKRLLNQGHKSFSTYQKILCSIELKLPSERVHNAEIA